MNWRLIRSDAFSSYRNMALDEAISEHVADGGRPVIRFYKWRPSAVSIGYFQRMKQEVDIDTCEEKGIDYVRRRTGGGAVYHDSAGELTYSVIAPEEMFTDDITKSYHTICGWLIDGLEQLGVNASFAPVNDVVVDGRKVSGNAQTRRNDVLLQHGTILHELDPETMFSALKVDAEKVSDKMIERAEDRVCTVREAANVSREELEEALVDSFMDGKQYERSDYRSENVERAKELVEQRYKTDEWKFSR